MAKITEMTEDTAVGGAEKMYLVDGSQDKYAVLTSLKSLFGSQVATLATLKTYQGLANNQVIFLIGGTVDNDAKAGMFYWDAVSTATADDDDIVQVTGVTTGRWIRLTDQQYVNITGDTITGTLTLANTASIVIASGAGIAFETGAGIAFETGARIAFKTGATLSFATDVSLEVTDSKTTLVDDDALLLQDSASSDTLVTTTLANLGLYMQAEIQTARAWVNFNGTDTVAIRASYNVSSITDNGTGDYTVNFTNAMPDDNYSITATAARQTSTGATNQNSLYINGTAEYLSGSVRIGCSTTQSTTLVDPPICGVAIFR
jgi:hypothetical protein